MTVEFGKGGKRFRLHLPLSRFLLRFALKIALSDKRREGQGRDETESSPGERERGADKRALTSLAGEAVGCLKRYRRRNGRFVLLEAAEKDGGFFRITI